jgi:hypothetical protein
MTPAFQGPFKWQGLLRFQAALVDGGHYSHKASGWLVLFYPPGGNNLSSNPLPARRGQKMNNAAPRRFVLLEQRAVLVLFDSSFCKA